MHQRKLLRLVSLLVALCPLQGLVGADEQKAGQSAARSMSGRQAGEVRDDNGLNLQFVWCLPGTIAVRQPVQEDGIEKIVVTRGLLSHGFWLGKFELTQSQWVRLMSSEPWKNEKDVKEGADFPATWVSWNDATDFCRKLTEQERKAGRLPDDWEYTLPTEAQWGRACRAATDTPFSFGADVSHLGEYAWYVENCTNAGEGFAHRVGQKKPNPWGLHDMHGNVMEWCLDVVAQKLPDGRDLLTGEGGAGSYRVSQGGWWGGEARRCRSFENFGSEQSSRSGCIGFRVALTSVAPTNNGRRR